ncbi:MAG: lysoplasmalogenase [Saprospiraceae bacterium]
MDAIKTFPKFTIFYLIVMIVELLALTVIPEYHLVSKPFIMASLLGFYIVSVNPQDNLFLLALIFALLGDVFLLFKHDDFFIIGLVCFLIMQIGYFITFKKKKRIPKPSAYMLPALLAFTAIFIINSLWSQLSNMRLPVTVYAGSIVLMAAYAYLRHPRLRGYQTVVFGVVLFIISDGMLAFDKFGTGFPNARIFVMITYMIAQYCIVTGQVLSDTKRKIT